MDFVDCECQLLYKQNLETWFEEKHRTKKFSDEDLEFVQIVQQKYKYKYDDNDDYDYRERFHLNGRFGHLYFSEPDPVLFSLTELDGTVTSYERSFIEDEKSEKGDQDKKSGNKKAESSDSSTCKIDYQRIFIHNVIRGSNNGGKILAYSSDGHIFLIDLDTRIGKLVAIWPIDPAILAGAGSCYGLVPYDPYIKAAVNGDLPLMAATGPSDKEEEIQIRIFNVDTKECSSVKSLKLSAGLLDSEIHMLSFNPRHPELLYVTLIVSKSKYNSSNQVADGERSDENNDDDIDNDDDDGGGDDDDEDENDDDDDDDLLLLLFDVSTEKVLAEKLGVSLIPMNFFYDTVEKVAFLKQGAIIVTYKLLHSSSSIIMFLDAFSLEVIGSVNIQGKDAVLGSHLLLSSCKSQFAIFKCQDLDSSNELKYDIEVYKIPDNEFSLKNFSRKVILDKVDINHIDSLNLPNVLKNYLKL